ncbi:hypothetical protein H0H92_001837 [Tricholoma furcatifolium]|nr:hypothetical protein H0H92_001837 [Tricholoma furcatifolium]
MVASILRTLSACRWTLPSSKSAYGPSGHWSNEDMDPVPLERRTRSTWNFIAYWISDATNIAMWQFASSMLAVGLTWRQALLAITVGQFLISIVMVLNGTVGARLHISFPVLNRSSFGFWLSYFTVISRAILALFWFGIQQATKEESEDVLRFRVCLSNAESHLARDQPDPQPSFAFFAHYDPRFNSKYLGDSRHNVLLSLLAYTTSLPACLATEDQALLHSQIYYPILVWAMVKVPPSKSLAPADALNTQTRLAGSARAWAWLNALNSSLGVYATLAINIPDFTRYAKN